MSDTHIYICFVNRSGHIEPTGDSYLPEDFGGTIPSKGDLIPDPGVPQGLQRSEIKNREVQEVTARYFLPPSLAGVPPLVYLVVKSRPAEEGEESVVGP